MQCGENSVWTYLHIVYQDGLTWTRGCEHWHGIRIMMFTTVTLNKFSLAFQNAKTCSYCCVKDIMNP